MFFKNAMLEFSQLAEQMASIHEALAASTEATPGFVDRCRRSADKERRDAQLLRALAELSAATQDDGPFLIQVPQQLASLRKVVDRASERIATGIDPVTALRCTEALETACPAEIHTSLLEVAEGEVRRVLRLIEEQTNGSGRRRDRRGRRPSIRRSRKAVEAVRSSTPG